MHLPSFVKRTAAVAGIGMLATFGFGLSPAPAHALDLGGGFSADIYVAHNGAAHGVVTDSITGASYITVLTATGGGTCTLTNGETVIEDVNTGSGNPANTYTRGGCNLYDATAHYQLTYTPVLGATSTISVDCVWVVGVQLCSPPGVNLQSPL